MKKELEEPEVEELILDILESRIGFVSVAEISKILRLDYQISRSPQVIARYLRHLKKKGRVSKRKYG